MDVSGVVAQQAMVRSALAMEALKAHHNAQRQLADMVAETVDASSTRGTVLDISV